MLLLCSYCGPLVVAVPLPACEPATVWCVCVCVLRQPENGVTMALIIYVICI